MPSSLKRWLDKVHQVASRDLRPRSCKIAVERLEPTVVPEGYAIEELTSEFVKFWAKIKEDNGDGLEKIQKSALKRWHALRFEWTKRVDAYPIPLDSFVEIFDDYFFLGSLRPYTEVRFVDDTQANLFSAGSTRKRRMSPGQIHIEIRLKRPVSKLLGRASTQFLLATLLHEMTHAFLDIYSSPEEIPGCNRKIAETMGLTGHGPCWVKVAAAIEEEADRSLGRSWRMWDLGVRRSRSLEWKALKKWHGYRGMNMMDG